jgi:hypothetical protein
MPAANPKRQGGGSFIDIAHDLIRSVPLIIKTACLKRIEGCIQRGGARRIPGPLVVLLALPGPKALAAQRPGFPVAVNDEIGKSRCRRLRERAERPLRH